MYIEKAINNNVALGKDDWGHDVVVVGTGIGYHSMPYFLKDERRIQHVYRDVSDTMYAVIASLSQEAITIATDVVDIARQDLNCGLNPNLAFTLADHLQFTINRIRDGVDIENPLAPEVEYVYPREMEIGRKGLLLLYAVAGVEAPDHEAAAIALHIVNGEALDPSDFENGRSSYGSLKNVLVSTQVIEKITGIVEEHLGITIDRSSYGYTRFTAHLRYLIDRLSSGTAHERTRNSGLFREARAQSPEAYDCARAIDDHLFETYGWRCSDEELLYLMMHINRLNQSGSGGR